VNNIERLIDGLGLDLHTEVGLARDEGLALAFSKRKCLIWTRRRTTLFRRAVQLCGRNGFNTTGANNSTECCEPLE
jgi:hypothetical protein